MGDYTYLDRQIHKGKQTIYRVKNNTTGEVISLTSNQIKSMIKQGERFDGIRLSKTDNRIVIKSRAGLSDAYMGYNNSVGILTGEKLIGIANNYAIYKQRWYVPNLVKFCTENSLKHLSIIHGIRRTGKTVSMWHTINQLLKMGISSNNIVYITIYNDIDANTLYKLVNDLSQKYIFIDEVTKVKDILSSASYLSDYIPSTKRIVLTGTDSLVFPKIITSELFDRAYIIHSTLISCIEYMRLENLELNQSNVDRYEKYGGVFIQDEYATLQSVIKVLGEIIYMNMLRTILRNKNTLNLISAKDIAIEDIIYVTLNMIKLSVCPMNSIKIGSSLKAISKKDLDFIYGQLRNTEFSLNMPNTYKTRTLKKEVVNHIVYSISELDLIKTIENFADTRGSIKKISDEEIITLVQILYSSIAKRESKIVEEVDGSRFENFVIGQIYRYKIQHPYIDMQFGYCKYQESGIEHEVDLIIKLDASPMNPNQRKEVIAIEIKNSSKPLVEHSRHLVDNTLDVALGDTVTKRIVVYKGKTNTVVIEGKQVRYINVVEILKELGE